MHFISLSLLVFGALTVSHAQDDLDSHEVLKRLLSALTEKKQEEPVVHKSLWDELEEELTKRKEAKCGEQKKHCANKQQCIHVNDFCDGHDDCQDKSDEKNCQNHRCEAGMEKCKGSKTNQCVLSGQKCDGNPDCSNGADEQDCGDKPKYKNPEFENYFKTCKSDEFRCNNGRCVFKPFVCDKDDDCGDNSDEQSCSKKPKELGLSESTKNKLIRALVKRLLRK